MGIKQIISILIAISLSVYGQLSEDRNSEHKVNPCPNTSDILISYNTGLLFEQQYTVHINRQLDANTRINLEFNRQGIVIITDLDNKIKLHYITKTDIYIYIPKPRDKFSFIVKGTNPGLLPYIKSFKINWKELCYHPIVNYANAIISNNGNQNIKSNGCGRRKVTFVELIVNGAQTKPGDWPWHVALNKHDGPVTRYICGGTLISKTFVLTAAHCVTVRGISVLPESLSVVLGKYNFIGGDLAAQERQIHDVIVHDDFDIKSLDNDIALLKLKLHAVFDDYVLPACLWNNQTLKPVQLDKITGTVIGWGFDDTSTLSPQLRQATFPIISDIICIRGNPLFYSKVLNGKKFCAGDNKGTSPCNGDSGGGFHIFIPDDPNDTSLHAAGSWYVRGIVSLAVSQTGSAVCDPQQNAVFTDVAQYSEWIQGHVER